MKYLISLVIILITVSASYGATGSTSTGSTSTGSLAPISTSSKGGGGITRAWNYTTSQYEMLPQCFPWIFASEYFSFNLANMYSNQETCRADRAFDFRW